MRTKEARSPSIHKVRRVELGGKRGNGLLLQQERRKVRRADPCRIQAGDPDDSLTNCAGLVSFGRFTREIGLDRELWDAFDDMKCGAQVVYPMGNQLRLLIDAIVADEERVFGLEALAADRLFCRLAGDSVPSIDTVYRDLRRFDGETLSVLESLSMKQGLLGLEELSSSIHVDIDSTVEPLFGHQEGALLGPNPRYHGRVSYHPLLACIAETGCCIGAQLRPGDRGIGERDIPAIVSWLKRVREHAGSKTLITVRMDSAGDCAELLTALDNLGLRFVIKLKADQDLVNAALGQKRWSVTAHNEAKQPTERVAVLHFARKGWAKREKGFRVVALRSTERCGGQKLRLWDNPDEGTQFYVTNDWQPAPEEIPREYDGRAEIETIIRDLKHALALGKVPSAAFDANHAMFLLKILSHNLLRRYALHMKPRCSHWRTPWLRRLLIVRPGRLLRSGRQWTIRTPRDLPMWE
jgi:hypothetical protein